MHTMWKGSLSFGLVNIPIKLYAATEDKDIKLRNLHGKCHTPIQYEKKCPNCDEEVKQEDIVKGYEYVKGKFVILSDEELKDLKKEHEDKAVEIVDFVSLEEIDPIYFNRAYFLEPGENGAKAYALLREALKTSGKIGIAEITIRSKQQMAIVRVYENCLVMETIHYPDEVRSAKEVPSVPENTEVQKKELDTAIMLIDQLTAKFDPSRYQDDYREDVKALIQQKITKNEGKTPEEIANRENVVDLMGALQASINRSAKTKEEEKQKTEPKADKKTAGEKEEGKKRKTSRKKA
ncbi:Ku protein [Metabacillus sp. GX 13764]|uniref:non-homologous end joining protein Ku n=1 Tax=Metabacillus kandeliae TaxID=2900151 RepID=UPI001E5D359C|nr:Ku protein [Metabacillus kandeliae]MCD7036190.1 Ku protein [Metabacillus kandeliae]